MHEKAKFVCLIYIQPQKVKFKSVEINMKHVSYYSKTCVKWSLSKRPKIGFQDQVSLNAGQKYCHQNFLFCLFLAFLHRFYCIQIEDKNNDKVTCSFLCCLNYKE